MCVVSMIGDGWGRQFPDRWPGVQPWEVDPPATIPYQPARVPFSLPAPQVSRKDFDALKAEVEALKRLLLAAKAFDDATGQPHCEADAKVALIKAVAKAVGVDMDEVFEEKKKKPAKRKAA